ncbi:MAG: type II toxin-antitoxin system RelE/ParE family toxin [Nitrospinae bacterium]|nr:type II toxin-antitoxin system RelE/ParE family toxin [Nitrospinota bacterium]
MPYHTKVISSQEASYWTFRDYVEGTSTPIEDWYQRLSEDAKFLFQATLKNIRKTENPIQWGGFRFLKGKLRAEQIWELKFFADKRQYRILGIFGEARKQVVLLMGCYHKQGNYTPTDALDTALKRAKALKERRGGLRERKIRTDF